MRETTVGTYIRSKRLASGLSLRDVADRIGVSHVFLGEVERDVRKSIKRERLDQLAEVIPGFSATEAERIMSKTQPVKLSLEDAPPAYHELGLALARRIEKRDLKPSQLAELRRILIGGHEDE